MAEKNFKLLDEKYLILRKLGNGKLCEVFEVLDLKKQCIYAGKRYSLSTYSDLSEKFKQTVFTEINILQQADNNHILKCWDVVFTSDSFYLMLTYCGFGSLQNHLANQENRRLSSAKSIEFLRQIIDGYHVLYALGIVHGDIKSENLFMKSEDHLLIGDLNTSKSNLKASSIFGTELYSPPFKKNWGVRNYQHDVWSIGVVFFEMLFGIEEWYTNFTDRTFGENLVYPKSKELSNQVKFLISKFLDPKQPLTLHQMLEQLKFIRDPLNQEIHLEFSGTLLSLFKEFERKIGNFN
jgi:serine/threonine protein kinase